MCGVCGIYNGRSQEPVRAGLIEHMTSLIAHRGPDDHGAHIDGPLGLGVARLSIIDVNGGHQPMCNETGEVWVTFNGEIWNYKELRRRLLQNGHQFRTQSDTETIVHAYEEYGVDCVKHLHGMFGFAIWDRPRLRLLLARDKVGKKPLYYTQVDGDLIFASEIKALLAHPRVKREADVQAMADFLSVRYVPAPATLFAGIYKVMPGHWLLYENGTVRQQCYWDYTFSATPPGSIDECLRGIKAHVHRAVEERMSADVPVGAMLSGGVDSSIVSGIMTKLTDHKVKTFAVGFDHPDYSELSYARMVAEHFGTDHYDLVIRSSDLTRYWPLLTWHRDEPVSEPSDLGVYLLSLLARQHVKVVLSGEGGDEVFAGYPKYAVDWMAKYYQLLPTAARERLLQPLLEHLPYGMRKLQQAARTLSQPAPQRWIDWFGIFNGRLKENLLSPNFRASINMDSGREFRRWLENSPQPDDMSSMLYLDTRTWLPDNLLMKGDKMTMAASLEQRMPLLDYRLIEFAASIPSAIKLRGFRAKYLLKRTFADFLPQRVLTRKKMGFNVPTGIWFREGQRGLISRLLRSQRLRGRGYFNNDFVERMLHDHLERRTNYQAQLFTLASLELWFRVFIDGSRLAVPASSTEELLAEEPEVLSIRCGR
jgi:asparagine synthase (glutamine-hydrolysing)